MAPFFRPWLPLAATAVVLGMASVGCGPTRVEDVPSRLGKDERTTLEATRAEKRARPRPEPWQRSAPDTPPSFAPFTIPSLDPLEGVWLVAGELVDQRELWIVETSRADGGAKVTVVDRRGRERVHGVVPMTGCSVRMTNQYGRSRTRLYLQQPAQGGAPARTLVSARGAMAVEGRGAAPEQSGAAGADPSPRDVLICAGPQAYLLHENGRCDRYSEMLGVWEKYEAPPDVCGRDGEAIVVEGLRLEAAGDGVWMDSIVAASVAVSFADRGAAETALAAAPEPSAEDETATDTATDTTAGGTGESGDPAGAGSGATGSPPDPA